MGIEKQRGMTPDSDNDLVDVTIVELLDHSSTEARLEIADELAVISDAFPDRIRSVSEHKKKEGKVRRILTYASLGFGVGTMSEILKISIDALQSCGGSDNISCVVDSAAQEVDVGNILIKTMITAAALAYVRNYSYDQGVNNTTQAVEDVIYEEGGRIKNMLMGNPHQQDGE